MTTFTSTARPRPFGLSTSAGESSGLTDRMPPHDLGAEAGVLGSVIIAPDACAGNCIRMLRKPEVFFKEENQTIFRVLADLFENNSPIDAMILHSTLKSKNLLEQVGGLDYIKELANAVPTSAHAEYYAGIVLEKAMLRAMISGCTSTLRDIYESGDTAEVVLDRWHQRVYEVADRKHSHQAQNMGDILAAAMDRMDRQGVVGDPKLPTGLIELDELVGLHNGHLIVIGGRPSHGKTALSMNFVEHVAVNLKKPVAVFSLEMSQQQLAVRMLCSRSGVHRKKLESGNLTDSEKEAISHVTGELSAAPIFVDDTPDQSILDIRTKARRMKQEHGVEMIVVDYLQKIETSGQENRQQQIATISRGLKNLARELYVPVVVPTQLNRASESEQRLPRTSDLRESGAIEQDADEIILVHRWAVAHRGDQEWMDANPNLINEAIAVVGKQRDGECGNVKLTFLASQTRFVNYNPGV